MGEFGIEIDSHVLRVTFLPESGVGLLLDAVRIIGSYLARGAGNLCAFMILRHNRLIRFGSQDIGEALIAQGHAWYAHQFAGELTLERRQNYQRAEGQARVRNIGVWQQPEPMPPGECRKYKRAGKGPLCR